MTLANVVEYLDIVTAKAWNEPGDKLLECKGFEDKSRNMFNQVATHIATHSEYVSDLSAEKAQGTEMINMKEHEIIVV